MELFEPFVDKEGELHLLPPYLVRICSYEMKRPRIDVRGIIRMPVDKRLQGRSYEEQFEIQLHRLAAKHPVIWGIIQEFGESRCPVGKRDKFVSSIQEAFDLQEFVLAQQGDGGNRDDSVRVKKL